MVTFEQFETLVSKVKELEDRLAPARKPSFPENEELINEIRKGGSLTDAMAALQLGARLESSEKTLENLINLVTELAQKTGVDLTGTGSRPTHGTQDVPGSTSQIAQHSKKELHESERISQMELRLVMILYI